MLPQKQAMGPVPVLPSPEAMILVVAATEFEMQAFLQAAPGPSCRHLVCGIGPVEAALGLGVALSQARPLPDAVLNIGIAGAYPRKHGPAGLLDICVAQQEELGDFGRCQAQTLLPLSVPGTSMPASFPLADDLRLHLEECLKRAGIATTSGRFITVNCVSADRQRGAMLLKRYPDALCENMEGAALARVCAHFALPFAEMRCISNMVDDPQHQHWRLAEACIRCGQAAATLFKENGLEG